MRVPYHMTEEILPTEQWKLLSTPVHKFSDVFDQFGVRQLAAALPNTGTASGAEEDYAGIKRKQACALHTAPYLWIHVLRKLFGKPYWDATGLDRGDPHARPGIVCQEGGGQWLGGLRMTGFVLGFLPQKSPARGLPRQIVRGALFKVMVRLK